MQNGRSLASYGNNRLPVGIRIFLLLAIFLLAAIFCAAQPQQITTWLQVIPQNNDGTAWTGGAVTVTTILKNAMGQPVKTDGVPLPTDDASAMTFDITPGLHEVYLHLTTMDISFGPKIIEVLAGANQFTWVLPPLVPVDGDLLLDNKTKTKDDALDLRCYMTNFGVSVVTFSVPVKVTEKGYHLDLYPGYRFTALFISDHGYATAVFDIAADGTVAVPPPLALLHGGHIKTRFVDKEGVDIKVSGKFLLMPTAVSRFSPLVEITTDKDGIGTLPYDIPPGKWQLCNWGYAIPGYEVTPLFMMIGDKSETEMVIKLVKVAV